jgi:hypothetical protein
MSVFETATMRAVARATATVRLYAAREALWRARRDQADDTRSPRELAMCDRVGLATAELAAREQWLHWIGHGTTIRPEADGEWGNAAATPAPSGRPARRLRSVP